MNANHKTQYYDRSRALRLDALRHVSHTPDRFIPEAQQRYQRTTALAQVKPDPKPVMDTIVPGGSAPCCFASAISIGIAAAEQFP